MSDERRQMQFQERVHIDDLVCQEEAKAPSPRDASPEAEYYFREYRRRYPLRPWEVWSAGR